jgi:anionic cell wall polymer biosynthesis LytR-Cps2A-Psr (LCP) family protein
MAKTRKSVDGIIVRRTARTKATQGVRSEGRRVGEESLPLEPQQRGSRKKTADPELEDFLTEIGYEHDGGEEITRKPKAVTEVPEKLSRKERKRLQKEAKKAQQGANGKKKGKKKIILIVLACVLVVGVVGGVVGWNWIRDKLCQISVQTCEIGVGDIWGVITNQEEALVPLQEDKNGRTNVLVFGTSGENMDSSSHDGFQLADSIMVLSINQTTKDVKMVSLPRDLKSSTHCTATAKLNEVYWCTYNKNKDEKAAAGSMRQSVEEITGLKIQYFVHMNWAALVQAVDALGGIDIAIEYQGDKEKYTGDLPVIWTTDKRGIQDRNYDWACKNKCYFVKYENGTKQHLDGRHALALARARGEAGPAYGTNGNWSRERNQQAIIEAIVQKGKQTNFATDLGAAVGVLNAIGDNIRTDFRDKEYRTLMKLGTSVDLASMQSVDLQDLFSSGLLPVPGVNGLTCGGASPGCLSYVYPKLGTFTYTDIQKRITQKFSSDPAVSEGAKIDVLNGGAANGAAKTQANKLTDKGYKVDKITDASKKNFTGITIVVINKEMKGTRKALTEMFAGATVVESLPEGVSSTADFVIVVGAEPETQ